MFAIRPVKPQDALSRIFDSMTIGAWENSDWSPTEALKPFLAFLTALCMALYILSYPEKHRKLSIFIFALPISYACYHHVLLVPCHSICDMPRPRKVYQITSVQWLKGSRIPRRPFYCSLKQSCNTPALSDCDIPDSIIIQPRYRRRVIDLHTTSLLGIRIRKWQAPTTLILRCR